MKKLKVLENITFSHGLANKGYNIYFTDEEIIIIPLSTGIAEKIERNLGTGMIGLVGGRVAKNNLGKILSKLREMTYEQLIQVPGAIRYQLKDARVRNSSWSPKLILGNKTFTFTDKTTPKIVEQEIEKNS